MSRRATEKVQRLPYVAGAVNSRGNPTDTWGAPVAVRIYGFDPGSVEEPRDGQDRVIVAPTLYTPGDVIFQPQDKVIVRGKTYEVDGETREWRHPSVSFRGNVTTLRRVEG